MGTPREAAIGDSVHDTLYHVVRGLCLRILTGGIRKLKRDTPYTVSTGAKWTNGNNTAGKHVIGYKSRLVLRD